MKILMVNDYRESIGGAEHYMYDLGNTLSNMGHNVEYFTSDTTTKEYYRNLNKPKLIKYITKIFNLRMLYFFYLKLNKFKPDIIHIHGLFNELSPLILIAKQQSKVIITVHGYELIAAILDYEKTKNCKKSPCIGCINCIGVLGFVYEKIKRVIYKILLSKVDLFITPSFYMSTKLREIGYLNTIVIHLGLGRKAYQPIKSSNKALFVGRIVKEKGIFNLIYSIVECRKYVPNIRLTIIGDGPYMKILKKTVQLYNLKNIISILGQIDRAKLTKYYRSHSYLISPSIYPENSSISAIEAISNGRPVIATDVGGFNEIVLNNYNGLLIKPNDIRGLSDAIIKMSNFTNNKINFLGRNSYKYSIATFSYKLHISKILHEYNTLLH